MKTSKELINTAHKKGLVIPGFNIPYLPMMEPVIAALKDTGSFGFIMVARLEWLKFGSKSMQAIKKEYDRVKSEEHVRLHLDHIPVIDEDNLKVDYLSTIAEALDLGYDSVMVDGSRLPLEENISCTAGVVKLARRYSIPVEAELGAVLGHEAGPLPSYEELFLSGKGFTSPSEAARFVKETEVDWLSVALGNIHGAISEAKKSEKKVEARLDIAHLQKLRKACSLPLVLHGGSGIKKECVLSAIKSGIAKINIGAAIRQPFEKLMQNSPEQAKKAVYETAVRIIKEELEIEGLNNQLLIGGENI